MYAVKCPESADNTRPPVAFDASKACNSRHAPLFQFLRWLLWEYQISESQALAKTIFLGLFMSSSNYRKGHRLLRSRPTSHFKKPEHRANLEGSRPPPE